MRFADEFKKFIMRGNVVDLAVGVVIGAAFGAIVTSLVQDIFMPLIALISNDVDVSGLSAKIGDKTILPWGKFLQAIINFLIVSFCLFLIVKAMNRLMRREEKNPTVEPTPTEKLLAEIRDLLARGQPAGPAAPANPPTH